EIAVEVSSIWRSKDAGKEDAFLAKWFERVRAIVAGQVRGLFYLTLPIRIPNGANPVQFAQDLIVTIQRHYDDIARQGHQGKMLEFTVAGVSVWISLLPINANGSDIDYARSYPDMAEFPLRVRTCLDDKAPKLKRYAEAGTETWIIIFNTMGVAMSPSDADR